MSETSSANIDKNQNLLNMEDDEFDLLGFLYLLRSKIVYILLLFILGGTLSGLYTKFFITPTYTAVTKLYVVSASTDSLVNLSDLQIGASLTADYEHLILTRPILEQVITNLGLEDVYNTETLKDTITITNPEDSRMLYISIETTNPQYSMDIANEIARQTVEQLGDLMDSTPPKIAEKAVYPEHKTSPSVTKNAILGCLAFSIVYIGILLVRFLLDNKIDSEQDVEKYLGMPPIGIIPELSKK
ncbi:MAG: Wzz/FepE/Etk N-terminal domain-containing protein [Firmicutes bacterium]|nr:Wzz/FepE/Etk N-terminal domain-containing protein [Bacillota bacterium]